jgi:glycosyltransferase involved in cell wall biosynthesis
VSRSIKNNLPRSRHFSLISQGGAWIASSRIAYEISKMGADCVASSIKSNLNRYEYILNRLGSKVDFEISTGDHIRGSLYKSTAVGQSIFRSLEEETTDVINLHWVPGKMTHSLKDLMQKYRVVFTVHDMNLFTGFCHHAGDCSNFEKSCQTCPQSKGYMAHSISKSHREKRELFKNSTSLQIISPSQWLASQARKSSVLEGTKITVIKNPVPLDIFKPNAKTSEKANLIKLGILGSDADSSKGVARLIPVLQDLIQMYPIGYLQFLVIGRKHSELPAEIQQEVIVKNDDLVMSEALSTCDLLLYTSKYENLPSLLTEAQACGVPILAMDVGGVRETFLPGLSGMIVPESEIEFKKCLISLLQSPEQLRAFSLKSRKFAEKEFDGTHIAEQYLNIYTKALSEA